LPELSEFDKKIGRWTGPINKAGFNVIKVQCCKKFDEVYVVKLSFHELKFDELGFDKLGFDVMSFDELL
jgi:hypothetical protein